MASQKYILKPTPLQIGEAAFGVGDLLQWLINSDAQFNQTGPGIRAAVRIEEAITKCADLGYIGPVKEDDLKVAAAAAEKPTAGYPKLVLSNGVDKPTEVFIGRQILPLIDAIQNAVDEPPKTEEKKPDALPAVTPS